MKNKLVLYCVSYKVLQYLLFLEYLSQYQDFNKMLDKNYQKPWNVHAAEPSDNHEKDINYLARYLKRPPMADTRIERYEDNLVTFNFLDHHTGKHSTKTFDVPTFIGKIIQHIPDKHFKLVRYYGWLSNRTRGVMIPLVNKALKLREKIPQIPISFQSMLLSEFGRDPLKCPICKVDMLLTKIVFGETTSTIIQNHEMLAFSKK